MSKLETGVLEAQNKTQSLRLAFKNVDQGNPTGVRRTSEVTGCACVRAVIEVPFSTINAQPGLTNQEQPQQILNFAVYDLMLRSPI